MNYLKATLILGFGLPFGLIAYAYLGNSGLLGMLALMAYVVVLCLHHEIYAVVAKVVVVLDRRTSGSRDEYDPFGKTSGSRGGYDFFDASDDWDFD